MKALRWLLASLLWIVGGLIGLVGVVLCVTIVLAPLGVVALLIAGRIIRTAGQLAVPRKVRHPLEAIGESVSDAASGLGKAGRKKGRRARRVASKKMKKVQHAL